MPWDNIPPMSIVIIQTANYGAPAAIKYLKSLTKLYRLAVWIAAINTPPVQYNSKVICYHERPTKAFLLWHDKRIRIYTTNIAVTPAIGLI